MRPGLAGSSRLAKPAAPFLRSLARADLHVILRHCGHAPMLEHPEAFGGVVRAWLESRMPEFLPVRGLR